MNSKIISIGSYTPDNIVTNKDLEETVDTTDECILSRTGIPDGDGTGFACDGQYRHFTLHGK